MRLLHFRNDHEQRRPVANESKPQSGGDCSILARQCVPLRYAPAHHRCGPPGGQDDAGARAMSEPRGKFILEPERYEFAAAPMHQFDLARRDFFKLIGAGIAVFAIAKDATAEQDTALTPFDAGTFGSRTTPTITPQLRRVSAAARDILVEAAAKNWNVAPEGLVAADARVSDPASGRSLKYAELARGKTLAQNLPAEDPVAPASQWTIAGRAIPKVDGRAFVTGRHQYTPDLRPAGMLYGKVLRPPSFGATLTAYDDSAAKAMTGVFVVRDGEFVGAAAPSADEAQSALDAIHAQWKEVPQIANKEIFSYLKQNAAAKTDDRFRKQRGSVEEGLASAAHRVDAIYTVAYIAHAPLEPRAAVAQWADGKLTVWTGTQRPFANRDELADIFHLSESDVRVIVPDTGSAYGGKHTSDAAIEAARLARAARQSGSFDGRIT